MQGKSTMWLAVFVTLLLVDTLVSLTSHRVPLFQYDHWRFKKWVYKEALALWFDVRGRHQRQVCLQSMSMIAEMISKREKTPPQMQDALCQSPLIPPTHPRSSHTGVWLHLMVITYHKIQVAVKAAMMMANDYLATLEATEQAKLNSDLLSLY